MLYCIRGAIMHNINNRLNIRLDFIYHRKVTKHDFTRDFRKRNCFAYFIDGVRMFNFGKEDLCVKSGDILYLPYGCHYTSSILTDNVEYFQLDFSVFDNNNNPISLFDEPHIISDTMSKTYYALFSDIYSCFLKKDSISYLNAISNLIKIIPAFTDAEYETYKSSKEYKSIAVAVNHITEFYQLDTSSKELADMCSVSVSHLEKTFKKIFMLTPVSYRNHIRTEQAKILLEEGFSIDATAQKVGFSDRYYFSKIFKRNTGINPGEFCRNSFIQ